MKKQKLQTEVDKLKRLKDAKKCDALDYQFCVIDVEDAYLGDIDYDNEQEVDQAIIKTYSGDKMITEAKHQLDKLQDQLNDCYGYDGKLDRVLLDDFSHILPEMRQLKRFLKKWEGAV